MIKDLRSRLFRNFCKMIGYTSMCITDKRNLDDERVWFRRRAIDYYWSFQRKVIGTFINVACNIFKFAHVSESRRFRAKPNSFDIRLIGKNISFDFKRMYKCRETSLLYDPI